MRCRYVVALLFAMSIGAHAFAQESVKCSAVDTISSCLDRFVPQDTAARQEQAEERTEDTTATAVTGLTNIASPAESSLKDFLSLLAASLESATSAQQGQAFTFDWNPPFALAKNIGLKFQASFAETKLNDEVTTHLAGNADQLAKLTDSLEFGDDAKLSGFVGRNSFTHGRGMVPQRDWFRPMRDVELASRDADVEEEGQLIDDFDLNTNQQLGNDADGRALDREEADRRVLAVEALGRKMKASRAAREPFFLAFAKLLNNQPQYYGAVIYHARKNLIGPNEWSGKFTYEFAGNNLNAFRKATPACATAEQVRTVASNCAQELIDFANATHPGIERVAVSLEYHKVNRRWIADPTAGLDFGFPRTRSFVGTVAFGTVVSPMLPLRSTTTGVADARFDFTAKYELPEDHQSDEKGFVGTLTYTQKINETFSLPLSFVYSDHESDLINVQKRFSARFGLMYKLPDFK
jgi:hypothetical protein